MSDSAIISSGSAKSLGPSGCPPCDTPGDPCWWGWDAVGKAWHLLNGFGPYPNHSCSGLTCGVVPGIDIPPGMYAQCGCCYPSFPGEYHGQIISQDCDWCYG
jgi:hypothetical protein